MVYEEKQKSLPFNSAIYFCVYVLLIFSPSIWARSGYAKTIGRHIERIEKKQNENTNPKQQNQAAAVQSISTSKPFQVMQSDPVQNVMPDLPVLDDYDIGQRTRKRSILFVLNEFPKFIQPFILNQITGLIDREYEVFILAKHKRDQHWDNDIIKYDLLKRTFYKELPPFLKRVDIIYCHFGPCGNWALDLKRKRGLQGKLVTCFRGDDITKKMMRDPHLYDELLRAGDLFLPVCNYFKKRLINLGCNPKKILVHHSAIDCSKFESKPRTLNHESIDLISVSRLVEKKGIAYAIQAVAHLVDKYPMLHYTIIGDGPEKAHLAQLVEELGVQNNVHLKGWVCHEDVARELDRATIFILPSITAANGDQEGIPNALKEAMAMGLPVISTRHSGIPELVIDGETGFLAAEKDVDGLVEKIETVIKKHEKWPRLCAAARRKVEVEHDIEKQNKRLEEIFRVLC